MPHSSGGGHHGGGHHSGSHHRSSSSHRSSGSSSPSISRRYFHGSRRYRYRSHGRTRYVYSTGDPSKRFSFWRLLLIIFYLPFLAVMFFVFLPGNRNSDYLDHTVIVRDEAGVFGNTEPLFSALENFRENSGVTPAVISVGYDVWADRGSLEDYAYDRYLDEFKDENHWLIVYTADPVNDDWAFEGMQGDDTDSILTPLITNNFNKHLYDALESGNKSPEKCIADAFDYIGSDVKKSAARSDMERIVPSLIFIAFILVHAYFMCGFNDLKYKNAVPAPEDDLNGNVPADNFNKDDNICPSCGFPCAAEDKKCPVCGAKLK